MRQLKISPYSLSFNVDVARQVSLNAAIVLNHLIYWLTVNKRNGHNFINGRTWMYETIKSIAAFLDFLSEKQVREAIQQLIECGVIVKDYHNNNPFNRMAWYAVTDESILGVSNKHYEGDEKAQSDESGGRSGSKKNYDGDEKATSEGDEKAPSLIQTNTKKNTHKEQQHVGAFYACLLDLDLPKDVKIRISKYPEEEVKRAVEWAMHPDTVIKTSLAQAIQWALKEKPAIPVSTAEMAYRHEKHSRMLEDKIESAVARFIALSAYAEICFDGSQREPFIFEYNDPNFLEKLSKQLVLEKFRYKKEKENE